MKWFSPAGGTLLAALVACYAFTGCTPAPSRSAGTGLPAQEVGNSLNVTLARGESRFIALPEIVSNDGGGTAQVGAVQAVKTHEVATGSDAAPPLAADAFTLYQTATRRRALTGPMIDQFTGLATATRDAGGFLVPTADGKVSDFKGLQLFVRVPPDAAAGDYRAFVTVQPAKGGRPVATGVRVHISDITLPLRPLQAAIALCTTAELTAAYPNAFKSVQASYLDRGAGDQAKAIKQLDAVVRAAHQYKVALFIQDMAPVARIDEVGAVALDWDAYDRTMGPYFDGTAFDDHAPHPVWLVPAPPRRIWASANQLGAYWNACLQHASDKGWTASPVLFDPRIAGFESSPDRDVAYRGLQLVRDANVPVVAAAGESFNRPTLWAVNDLDTRLPPVGALGDPRTVRVWPTMCQARGTAGLLWPHALGKKEDAGAEGGKRGGGSPMALLQPEQEFALPTLRLSWLLAGLDDAGHLGLLQQRGSATEVAELLAGAVGRAGVMEDGNNSVGYLYAGWPEQDAADPPAGGPTLESMVDQLVIAATPGSEHPLAEDDPALLRTRMYLAQTHRLVARVGGYDFGIEPTNEGTLLRSRVNVVAENPLQAPTRVELSWPGQQGDLQVVKTPEALQGVGVGPLRSVQATLEVAGHLDTLRRPEVPHDLTIRETAGGAALSLPVMLPVARVKPIEPPPKMDGRGDAFADPAAAPVPLSIQYLNRPDLLAGHIKAAPSPATAQVRYDNDFVYVYVNVPQEKPAASEDRNSDWPVVDGRWWDQEGVQLFIAGGTKLKEGVPVFNVGVKPSGVVMTRSARVRGTQLSPFTDGPAGVQSGISRSPTGYSVTLAVPRSWFPAERDADASVPAWRINLLHYRAGDNVSSSWSGPLVNDADVQMMGVMIGEP